jgi:hypothetical protein
VREFTTGSTFESGALQPDRCLWIFQRRTSSSNVSASGRLAFVKSQTQYAPKTNQSAHIRKSVILREAPPSVAEAMLPALFNVCEE